MTNMFAIGSIVSFFITYALLETTYNLHTKLADAM